MIAFTRALPVTLAVAVLLASSVFAEEDAAKDAAVSSPADPNAVVEAGKRVSIMYDLTLDDGTQVDSNSEGDPLEFTVGQNQIVPGLEKELLGLKAGDEKKVVVSPEGGYGPIRKDAFQEVPLDQIPEEARTPGAVLIARNPAGGQTPVRISEVKDDVIVVDFNHPLAGKTLNFAIEIVAVR